MSSDSFVPSAQDLAPQSWFADAWLDDAQSPPEPPLEATVAVPTLQLYFETAQAPCADDIAVFAKEAMLHSVHAAQMDQLAFELGELIEAGHIGSREGCTFDLDVPGFGRMEGRVSIRRGQAELELHVLRPAAAAVLRARLPELQRMVDRESGGDVNLFIV